MASKKQSAESKIVLSNKISLWPIAKLKPYENNPRTHSDAQVDKIAQSISRFGFTVPILVDGEATIIAGHGRLAAALKLHMEEVPVIELTHLTADERRAYLIADNQLTIEGGWDDQLLTDELMKLKESGFDTSLTGFDKEELDKLLTSDKDIRYLQDFDATPAPLPVWIMIATQEDELPEIVKALNSLNLKKTRIEISNETK